MEYVNLTPHEITLMDDQGNVKMKIPPSGQTVRVKSEQRVNRELEGGIKIYDTVFTEIEGLPEKKEDTIYIVSTLVLQALKANGIERDDVVAPNTSPDQVVRDENGRIIGVKSFQRLGGSIKKRILQVKTDTVKLEYPVELEGSKVKMDMEEFMNLVNRLGYIAKTHGHYTAELIEEPSHKREVGIGR